MPSPELGGMLRVGHNKIWKKKPKTKQTKKTLTGVCLVVAVELTKDLKLILSTKKHQTKQNKENKPHARIHLLRKKEEKDSL